MHSQQDNNNPDLLELKENPHRRVKTYGMSGMMNNMMNTFPGVLLQTCLEWNMVKIERKRRMVEKAGARNKKRMCQR